MNNYCSYYHAHIVRKDQQHVVSVLKSLEYVCFDRTLDKVSGLFEIFVPESQEKTFLKIMNYFKKEGIVTDMEKLENRLIMQEV